MRAQETGFLCPALPARRGVVQHALIYLQQMNGSSAYDLFIMLVWLPACCDKKLLVLCASTGKVGGAGKGGAGKGGMGG